MYPADPTIGMLHVQHDLFLDPESFSSADRRPALRSVLRSLLVTYSSLTGSLLAPPPLSPEVPPDWQRHVEWINVLSQNLMAAANDLRPVQVCPHL